MIVIGTRASALALTQSRQVSGWLGDSDIPSELKKIVTQGDRVTHLPLDKLAGKGFFTKEVEEALLEGSVDVAVHCLKDLPSEATPGLVIESLPWREDARDVAVIAQHAYDPNACTWPIKPRMRIGTSAVRRKAQLAYARPDLVPVDIRGNVPTRLAKLDQGMVDAVVLANAGLRRLGLSLGTHHAHIMPVESFVPAPGQGMLALQCREDDADTRKALRSLHHEPDAICVRAERTLLSLLQAGCHVPLGAFAERLADGQLRLRTFYGGDERRQGPWRLSTTGHDPLQMAHEVFAVLNSGRLAGAVVADG